MVMELHEGHLKDLQSRFFKKTTQVYFMKFMSDEFLREM